MGERNSDCKLSEICCIATFAITANPVEVGADDVIRLHPDQGGGDNGMLTSTRALLDGSSYRDMDVVTTSMHRTVVSCSVHSKHFAKTKQTMWMDFSSFCAVCESKAYFLFTTCCQPSEGFISFTNDIDESNGAYIPFYEIVSMGGKFISGGHRIKSSAPWLQLINIVLTPQSIYRRRRAENCSWQHKLERRGQNAGLF